MFGVCDTSHTPALGFMQVVGQRDAATLLLIVRRHVAPGTIIWSDQWAAYRNISHLPNVASHSTVNHSVEFVAPSGTHTQNIESYWCRVKMKLKRMKGCPEDEVAGYLDEFMWRERHGNSAMTTFNNICRDIAAQYPV